MSEWDFDDFDDNTPDYDYDDDYDDYGDDDDRDEDYCEVLQEIDKALEVLHENYPDDYEGLQELDEAVEILCKKIPPEKRDMSPDVLIIMDGDEWERIVRFLEKHDYDIPDFMESNPSADPKELANRLHDKV